MPPRRVPIAIKPKLQEELERLEHLEVIKKVEGPTDWVSSLVNVIKPSGKLRVCIDPQHLNQALKREQYPLPVIDDVLPKLAKVKIFSKADCKEGFLQCELDEESSHLTTCQTPWGRYRWCRLPFGLSPSPELFQMKLDQCLEGLPGIHTIADDILITGQGETYKEAESDHDENMTQFLNRCEKMNIKLNKAKFEYKCDEITYIGHRLTNKGLKPDPNKVEAILNMGTPANVEEIQRFVGMVKYLAKFLPDLSDISEPLRRLTHKDTEWCWTEEQSQAFHTIKQRLTTAPILTYFDPKVVTEGQGDASEKGLGFVLLQNGHPITYASRALTPAETRYSQIEKELLAQIFGLERNHEYTYGRQMVLWTDHKPLVSISRKPLANAPKRLQRLLLRMQRYDVNIQYKPGPEMYLADTLSRAYLKTSNRSAVEEEVESVHMIDTVPITHKTHALIKAATTEDESLQTVKRYPQRLARRQTTTSYNRSCILQRTG